jgi:histone H2A
MAKGTGGRGAGSTKPRKSKADKAGLVFPVSRIKRYLKVGRYASRISVGSAVYMAAVLEYLTAEIVELSGNAAKDHKKKRITPRHILLALRHDMELNTLCQDVTIPSGGVLPNIHSVLLPKNKKKEEEEETS